MDPIAKNDDQIKGPIFSNLFPFDASQQFSKEYKSQAQYYLPWKIRVYSINKKTKRKNNSVPKTPGAYRKF